MEKMELIAPCHFGMEAVLKREVLDLGYEISTVEDGRVCFWGDAQAICDANSHEDEECRKRSTLCFGRCLTSATGAQQRARRENVPRHILI